MTMIRVHVFGKFRLTVGDVDAPDLESRKAQELITYLLLHREQHHYREALASLLWPESSAAQARRNLRQLLWQIQSTLARSGAASHLLVDADAEWLQLHLDSQCWVDVAILQQAWYEVKDIPGEALSRAQYHAVREAVDLYRGPLLDGCYEAWCLFERERLQTLYLALQEKLMVYYEHLQQYEHGLQCGLHVLKHDRARERTHRRMMRLYYLSGDRTAALRQFERCAAALSEELDVAPDERTQALYEQIKRAQLGPQRPGSALVVAHQLRHMPETSESTAQLVVAHQPARVLESDEATSQQHLLHALTERLRQFQLLHSNLQRDIQRTLHLIEQTLSESGGRAHAIPALPDAAERIMLPLRVSSGHEHQPHVSSTIG